MSLVILNHKVKDFDVWKPYYAADTRRREAAGIKELYLTRNEADPNDVFIIMETPDVAKAMKMMEDSGLQEIMKNAGVITKPTVTVLKKA